MDETHHIANLSDCHRPLVIMGSTSLHALQPVNKVHIPHLRVFLSTSYDAVRPPVRKKNLDHFLQAYMGQFPQDGENGQNVALFIFLELCCDQTI